MAIKPSPDPSSGFRLLRPEEAADRLGISRTKIYALLRRGEIRSVKIDGLRRISTTALEDYVADLERRVGAA